MIARFCAYGFLKNQRYFEPFIVLYFLAEGLTFFEIGLLVAVREVATNALEIASGGLADTWGRRRSMLLSLFAYLASFAVFGWGAGFAAFAVAMTLYGVGDAFRSGTHKAMILTWLRLQQRVDERTEVYGLTRSWSKTGSAVAVLVGSGWVFWTGEFRGLFWLALPAYGLGIANIATYPSELEGEDATGVLSGRAVVDALRDAVRSIAASRPLRGLMAESSAFMGAFESTKDYLQPLLQAAAASAAVGVVGAAALQDHQRTALLIAPVYLTIYVTSAVASRRAGALARLAGSDDAAARWIWRAAAAAFCAVLASTLTSTTVVALVGLSMLFVLEAVWRPIVIGRIDAHAPETQGATILSVESQVRSVATMALAPAIGAAVDWAAAAGQSPWWPVAAVGMLLTAPFAVSTLGSGAGQR